MLSPERYITGVTSSSTDFTEALSAFRLAIAFSAAMTSSPVVALMSYDPDISDVVDSRLLDLALATSGSFPTDDALLLTSRTTLSRER
ncbi:hypothetical protein NP493_565g00025 [Ridgeia piscesae]|uniref:Uncharacterized protein n=1 Tax=Ridgeia piscesae TaxID=27915 RepID=A0AAD9NPW2_RIDPI|nr:hypothetical protein NP493_565g00025 [Ridgeia piscesae]